ncbi:MAG: hypothetical protein IPG21_05295 [Saprospiraceae bacterium]|nr:hypothetical protein [Candidatus Vicinibacter affinis]
MDKKYILDHVVELSAQQLFDAIDLTIVTLEELIKSDNLDATKRKAITALQKARAVEDDKEWDNAQYTEQGCLDYLLNYPSGKHIENAQQQLEYFKRQRTQKNEERNQIIDKLRTNPNSFTPSMLRTHLDDNKITKNDLLNAGIPIEIINRLDNTITPELKLG